VRRRCIDHRNHTNRNAVIGARQHKRAGVRKADLCRASADLADGVRRAVTAHERHVKAGLSIVATLKSDVVVGVAAVEAEIGDESDVLGACGRCRDNRQQADDGRSREMAHG
jgi:hypothetical protein